MMADALRRATWTACALGVISSTAMAAPDPCNATAGRDVFATQCGVCHALAEDRVGPRLEGIVGRKAGTTTAFGYTAAMEGAGFEWDATRLDAFLKKPAAYLPGTAMAFAGVSSAAERKALICFLGQRH
jgi:cytochrome c